jgi:hypothetical protein
MPTSVAAAEATTFPGLMPAAASPVPTAKAPAVPTAKAAAVPAAKTRAPASLVPVPAPGWPPLGNRPAARPWKSTAPTNPDPRWLKEPIAAPDPSAATPPVM